MALAVEIELISGRYDAAGAADRDAAEWPPHPARVFCALVASARSDADRDALRWLERLPPPDVQAAATAPSSSRGCYVVTNTIPPAGSKGGSQFHLGRTNALRVRHSAVPASSRVRLLWPDAVASADTLAVLDGLARRVPYLGRSTGVAALSVGFVSAPSGTDLPEGLVRFDPTVGTTDDGSALRVPYPGYVDQLIDQHENGRPAWEVSCNATYRRADDQSTAVRPSEMPAPSVYADVIILRFIGLRPDGRLTTSFTEALRRAVMSATEDPLPSALHGHGADGRPHVAFLALPNADNPAADGHLLGLAVAVPELLEAERRAIVRGVLAGMRSDTDGSVQGGRVVRLRVPRIGEVELAYQPGLVRPWGARQERWRRGSDHWVSVTPVVLDRYPKNGDIDQEIVRACVNVGLPEPRNIVVSTAPLVSGGIRMRPGDLPKQVQGKIFRHVELRFDHKVSGPVLLGAGRYLGVGLLAPLHSHAAEMQVRS